MKENTRLQLKKNLHRSSGLQGKPIRIHFRKPASNSIVNVLKQRLLKQYFLTRLLSKL